MSTSDAPAAPEDRSPPDDGPPPFLGRWRNVYLALVLAQAVIIGLLALLTAALAP